MSRNTFTYNRQMKPTPTNLQLKSTDGIVSEIPTSRTPTVEHFLQENTTKSNKSLQRTGDNFRCAASTDSFSSPTECVTYFGNLQQDLKDFLKEYNSVQRRPIPSPFQLLSNATPTIELVSALVSMKRKRNVSIEQCGMENEEGSISKDDAEMNSDKERDSLNGDHLNLNAKLHKNHTYKQTCGADKLIEAQGELKNTTEASVFFSAPKKKKQLLESDENAKNETNWLPNEFRENDVTCNAGKYNPNTKLKPASKYSKSHHKSSATLSKPVLTFEIQKEHECNHSTVTTDEIHDLNKDLQ